MIDEPPPHGHFEVAARLGYAIPLGDLTRNVELGQSTSGQVPLWIEGGYRFASGFVLGAYLSYGFLGGKDASRVCPASWTSCHGTDVRLGVQMMVHLRPKKRLDPWFGIGVGREWLSYHATLGQPAGDVRDTIAFTGWELLNLQLGLDFVVTPNLALGPFVTLTISAFDEVTTERTGAATSPRTTQSLGSPFHGWTFLGVRGTFGLL